MKNIIKNNFSIISNKLIEDCNLSAGAKGVACYLLSKSEDWQFYMSDIQEHFNDTKGKIQKYIKELEDIGFLKRVRVKDKFGRFLKMDYIFNNDYITQNLKITNSDKNEIQQKENTSNKKSIRWKTQQMENPLNDKPGNIPILNNTNTNNTNINNTNNISVDNFSNEKIDDKKTDIIDNDFLEFAKGIKSIVENKKRIKVNHNQLVSWAKEVKKLFKKIAFRGEEQAKEDIKKAIQFLIDHTNEQYIPVVESGKSFFEKFSKIEDAMNRQKNKDVWKLDTKILGLEDFSEFF